MNRRIFCSAMKLYVDFGSVGEIAITPEYFVTRFILGVPMEMNFTFGHPCAKLPTTP